MDTFLQDLRYALRTIRQNPAFTFAAVAALALAIGANTAIFSVVNTVLLRPLPYPDPDRLVAFTTTSPQGSGFGASPTKFNNWRRQTGVVQDVSAYRFSVVNLTEGEPEQVATAHVSADFFRLFGAPVAAGRTFSADEDLPNGGHVVVLSEGFWRRRFGGDASVVARKLSLNGEPYEVLGVLGPFDTEAIQTPIGPPDLWLPFQIDPNSTMQGHFFVAAGRIKPGVTVAAAKAQLGQAATEFREMFPTALGRQASFGLDPMQDIIVRNVRGSLWVLVGAVTFVLLIACANVANLLLVRATVRRREIAIRAAMGAGRGRITRQLLTESVVLSMIGGVLGLGLGMAGIRALLAVNPGNIPRIGVNGAGVSIDWRVLAFTAAVSVVTGLVFGLVPALQSSRLDLNTTIKESSGRSGSGFRQNKARALLVVAEMGLALVLLVGRGAVHPHLPRAPGRQPWIRRAPGADAAHVAARRSVHEYRGGRAIDARRRRAAECASRRRGRGRRVLRAARGRVRPADHRRRAAARRTVARRRRFRADLAHLLPRLQDSHRAGPRVHRPGHRRRARRRHHQQRDGEALLANRRPAVRPDHDRQGTGPAHGARPAARSSASPATYATAG